jgi:hypothetical protein
VRRVSARAQSKSKMGWLWHRVQFLHLAAACFCAGGAL